MMKIQEQLAALLPGVEISEEFVAKLTASIEATVAQRVDEQTVEIKKLAEEKEKEHQTQLQEVTDKANAYAEYVVEEMTKKVEDYCEYVVEQFVEDNRAKLVETEEYCRMAKTLRSIKEAFETNYFQVNNVEPATQAIADQLAEARSEHNKLFEQHRTLKRQVEEYSKYVESENRRAVFESVTADLADTQKERLTRLIQAAEFPTLDAYSQGLKYMVEEIGSNKALITEVNPVSDRGTENDKSPTSSVDDRMKAYLERL
jgi:hypothetical protein